LPSRLAQHVSHRSRDPNLAWALLDDDVSVLADGAGLLRVGLGRAGVGLGLEVVVLGVRHLPSPTENPATATQSTRARVRIPTP
jgi:hypothetical protein